MSPVRAKLSRPAHQSTSHPLFLLLFLFFNYIAALFFSNTSPLPRWKRNNRLVVREKNCPPAVRFPIVLVVFAVEWKTFRTDFSGRKKTKKIDPLHVSTLDWRVIRMAGRQSGTCASPPPPRVAQPMTTFQRLFSSSASGRRSANRSAVSLFLSSSIGNDRL